MAQVPYTGVPQVAPGGTPQSRFRADVSEATFGGNVGQAFESLGGQLQKSGNELFARGVAMQDLYNHSAAQEADANYTEQAGLLHANYNTLQGKAAVDAYPQYIEDLKKTRQSIRDGLPNEMAQKLFESSSNGTLGRTIFNGAGHAAGQNKKYALGASEARVSAIGNQTLSMPDDERSFNDGLAKTEQEVRAQGNLQGLAPEAIDEAVSMQKSALWSQRIKGMAKQDPMKAGQWAKEAAERGDLRGEDISKITSIVDQARRTVGSRNISQQVSQGATTKWGEGIIDIKSASAAIAQIESGGRYDLRVDTGSRHGVALGKYQVMSGFLPEFLREAGMPPMTTDEFLKSHDAQEQLFAARFSALMKETGSANGAAARWIGLGKPDAFGTDATKYVSRFNAALAKNAPLSAKVEMGREIASASAPDDPLFPDYAEQRIQTDHARAIAIKKDDEFRNRQVVEDGLMGGKSGELPTTVEELTNTPEKADAWEKLLPSTQRRYMGVLARNAKGDTNWTDDTLREYQKLKGTALTSPADFLDMDVVDTDLPNSAKRELINLQGRLKGKAEGDPRVARALNILAPELQAAGIDKKDKDTYTQFVATLEDQLKTFADDNKRPPKFDEVRTIGARLLQSQTQKGVLWNSKVPTFQVPVPADEAEKIKQSGEWSRMSITPTEQDIQRIYTRALFQKLYGGTTKAATPSPSPPSSQ